MAPGGLKKEHAEIIIDQYLDLSGNLEEFSLMPQGLFNENARLVVAGNSYVLKKMTSGRSIDRHRYGAKLQNILAAKGFPCPRVILTREEDEISSYDGSLWTVQTWAEGSYCSSEKRNGSGGLGLREEIATYLGTFHALSREALEQGTLPRAPEESRLEFATKISRIETDYHRMFRDSLRGISLATRLNFTPRKSSFQQDALVHMPVLKKGCRQLIDTDFSKHPSLNISGPCHGDINWENLFFQQGKLTAVLDFDNAMEMNQTFDAAAAAAVVCSNKPEYLDAFLNAYEQTNGASIDREIFPRLMLLKNVRSLLFQIKQLLAGGTGNNEMAESWRKFLAENIRVLTSENGG